jgi:hypothetical protein
VTLVPCILLTYELPVVTLAIEGRLFLTFPETVLFRKNYPMMGQAYNLLLEHEASRLHFLADPSVRMDLIT